MFLVIVQKQQEYVTGHGNLCGVYIENFLENQLVKEL